MRTWARPVQPCLTLISILFAHLTALPKCIRHLKIVNQRLQPTKQLCIVDLAANAQIVMTLMCTMRPLRRPQSQPHGAVRNSWRLEPRVARVVCLRRLVSHPHAQLAGLKTWHVIKMRVSSLASGHWCEGRKITAMPWSFRRAWSATSCCVGLHLLLAPAPIAGDLALLLISAERVLSFVMLTFEFCTKTKT